MPRFKLLGGTHAENIPGQPLTEFRTIQAGEVFESAHNLDKMFVNKFQRLADTVTVPEINKPKGFGEDVTELVADAAKKGFKVFKNEKHYIVVGEDAPEISLNGEGGTLKQAEAYIAKAKAESK